MTHQQSNCWLALFANNIKEKKMIENEILLIDVQELSVVDYIFVIFCTSK